LTRHLSPLDRVPDLTGVLVIYLTTFMRYVLAVTPKNYLLSVCHIINEGTQLTQGYHSMQLHNWGEKYKTLAPEPADSIDWALVGIKEERISSNEASLFIPRERAILIFLSSKKFLGNFII
jgi:hypothetical protein